MGFWFDLLAGRRYPSAYEPLRCVPPDELATFAHDADATGDDERLTAGQEPLDAGIRASSVA